MNFIEKRKKGILSKSLLIIMLAGSIMGVQAQEHAPQKDSKFSKFKEKVSLNGWVDFQYGYNYQKNNFNTVNESNVFQIRRARLDVKGNLSPRISFRLQGDFANGPRLIDAFAKVKFCKYINVQAGQFKIPFSIENAYSPLNLEFADNAQVISALSGYSDVTGISSYANGREIGVMMSGTLVELERTDEEKFPILEYSVGVFGGNGINVKTDNMAKDVAARVDFHPFLKELLISASGYWGLYEMKNVTRDGSRNRYAVGVEYKTKNLTIRSEYLYGQTDFYDTIAHKKTRMNTEGVYITAGYWFHFGWGKFSEAKQKLRPVARIDFYKKDIDANTNSIYYSVGADWWPEKHLRFQVNYILKQQTQYNELGHGLTAMLSVKF